MSTPSGVRGWYQRNESRLLRGGERGRVGQAVAGVFLLVAVGLFGVAAGPVGVVAGLVTAAVWWTVGPAYAVATGAVLLSALGPADQRLLGTGTLGLVVLVLAPVLAAPEPERYAAGVVLAAVGFVAGTWLLVQFASLWVAALVLLATLALVAYLLARYHLLALGLLGAETAQPASGGARRTDVENERLMDDERGADTSADAAS